MASSGVGSHAKERTVTETPLVGIIMGSTSDYPTMEGCIGQLEEFGLPYEVIVASAHRHPDRVHEWAAGAASRGLKVIIAAAGKAAHLPGVVAAFTTLPVVGVPMKTSDLGGMDSLLSIVQMPTGVPVATVAINGAKNAAVLAAQIIGSSDAAVSSRVAAYKKAMEEDIPSVPERSL
jgi:5-(carboxyamino)imidazole ribonucleotide mutase